MATRQPPRPHHHRTNNPAASEEELRARLAAVDDPDLDAALDAIVAAAPPLPYPVRARLAYLLGGHHTPRTEKTG
jgi:hypothetical protein